MTAHILLEALCANNQIARYYNIYISKDLFEEWMILINHGRIGFRGKIIKYSYSDYSQLIYKLQTIFRRRSSASSRIGCDYKLLFLRAPTYPDIRDIIYYYWPQASI